MEKVIGKLVDIFIQEQIIKESEREVYCYCFETIFSRIYFYGTILLIAFLTGNVKLTLVYYLGFLSVRFTAGGYHAHTRLRCYIMSILIYLFNLSLINFMPEKYLIGLCAVVYIIALPLIYALAPVDHVNRPFSAEECVKLKIRSKIAVTFMGLLALVIFNFAPRFAWALSCGTAFAAVSFLIAWCKQRREKYDQEICI